MSSDVFEQHPEEEHPPVGDPIPETPTGDPDLPAPEVIPMETLTGRDALGLKNLEMRDITGPRVPDIDMETFRPLFDEMYNKIDYEEQRALTKMRLILDAVGNSRTGVAGWNFMIRPIVEEGGLVSYQALITKPVDSYHLTDEMEIDEKMPKDRGKIEMRFDLDPDFFDFGAL